MKIGLALSGGGNRAAVFHLGVLARLAVDENDLFAQIRHLSTVSGGSLVTGLIYAQNNFKWPSGKEYLGYLPRLRNKFITYDLGCKLILETLMHPLNSFTTRAHNLARLLQRDWGITAKLNEVATDPHWAINSCCYETGKVFRFEPDAQDRKYIMGDYRFGNTDANNFILAEALAASAGFPVLINFVPLSVKKYKWRDRKKEFRKDCEKLKTIHLWDGGAYDNQGFEALMDIQSGWRDEIEFLLVSDAGEKPHIVEYKCLGVGIYRLATGIIMEQVGELRNRAFFHHIKDHKLDGNHFQIGDSCKYVLEKAKPKIPEDFKIELIDQCLGAEQEKQKREDSQPAEHEWGNQEVDEAAATKTGLQRFSPDEFDNLFRHGYEVANYTLFAYYGKHATKPCPFPRPFEFLGYEQVFEKRVNWNALPS